ncbi:MAG: hypothetical protein ABH867_01045 [Patescibacteria group bacterium]|nr:hypothetical protein [Patescibacteria group bacterium]
MESAVQIVLIISIFSLTVIFVTAGVWVVLILREIKKVLKKLGKVGEDVEETAHFVRDKVKEGFNMMTILTGVSAAFFEKHNLADLLSKFEKVKEEIKNRVGEEKEAIRETIASVKKEIKSKKEKKSKPRFFFKGKKS